MKGWAVYPKSRWNNWVWYHHITRQTNDDAGSRWWRRYGQCLDLIIAECGIHEHMGWRTVKTWNTLKRSTNKYNRRELVHQGSLKGDRYYTSEKPHRNYKGLDCLFLGLQQGNGKGEDPLKHLVRSMDRSICQGTRRFFLLDQVNIGHLVSLCWDLYNHDRCRCQAIGSTSSAFEPCCEPRSRSWNARYSPRCWSLYHEANDKRSWDPYNLHCRSWWPPWHPPFQEWWLGANFWMHLPSDNLRIGPRWL